MSMSDMIRAGFDMGLSNRAVADLIGCSVDYVRAIRSRERNRARYGTTQSPAELARRRERYHTEPDFRERLNKRTAAYRQQRMREDPEYHARIRAYYRARYRRLKDEQEQAEKRGDDVNGAAGKKE